MMKTATIGFIALLILSINGCFQSGKVSTMELAGSNALPDSLAAATRMKTPRSTHAATLLPDGKVLITGGMSNGGGFLESAEIYVPDERKFVAAGNMSARRVGHTATLLPDNTILIVGGLETAQAELYDPAKKTFTPTGALKTKRADHTATVLPGGKVLIAGGSKTGTAESPVAEAEIYDPATKQFTAAGSMNAARQAHTATLLKNGKVLITGGGIGRYPGTNVFKSAELYDPASGKSTPVGEMTAPRYKHAAILLADGRVLITGGSNERDWRGRYASAEIYDPVKNTFSAVGTMHAARFKHRDSLVLLRDGRVLIAGGGARPEIFNPKDNSFTEINNGFGEALFYSTATPLPTGEVLIAGGYGEGTPERGPVSTANAWLYRP